MLRRKTKREQSASLGAFEDRKGALKRQKRSKRANEEAESDDEVEEKLGTLVFGKQLGAASRGREELSSTEEDDEVSMMGKHYCSLQM